MNECRVYEFERVTHKWNVNIRIWSVTTSSRNNWVGVLTVSRTSANLSDAYKLFSFGPHKTSWTGNKIPNAGLRCKFSWAYWKSYKYTFLVHVRRKFETLWGQYCTNNGVFNGVELHIIVMLDLNCMRKIKCYRKTSIMWYHALTCVCIKN